MQTGQFPIGSGGPDVDRRKRTKYKTLTRVGYTGSCLSRTVFSNVDSQKKIPVTVKDFYFERVESLHIIISQCTL